MLKITTTEKWIKDHAGGMVGILEVSGIDNATHQPVLDSRKRETEGKLRDLFRGYSRKDFLALPVMAAYERYYKRFDKTYHVLLQVESIVLKEKNLPNVSPLVDSNFIAEVETLILTAGHDVSKLQGEITIDSSLQGDDITQMNGDVKKLYAGDMVMKDDGGICCSIIYGQDNRSYITKSTTHALFVSYVPLGIPIHQVEMQLRKIEDNIRSYSPSIVIEQRLILDANLSRVISPISG